VENGVFREQAVFRTAGYETTALGEHGSDFAG